jgi:hypothetical protein
MSKHVYVSVILNYINKHTLQFDRALTSCFNSETVAVCCSRPSSVAGSCVGLAVDHRRHWTRNISYLGRNIRRTVGVCWAPLVQPWFWSEIEAPRRYPYLPPTWTHRLTNPLCRVALTIPCNSNRNARGTLLLSLSMYCELGVQSLPSRGWV